MKMIECTFADGTHYSFSPADYPHWGPANQTAISEVDTPLGGRQETLYQLTGDQWLLVIETLGSVPTIRVVAPKKVAVKKAAATGRARRARPPVTNETTHGKWLTDERAMIWLLGSEGGRPPRAVPLALADLPGTLRSLANSKHLSPAAAEVVAHVKAVADARQFIKSRMRTDAKSDAPKKSRKRPEPGRHAADCERLFQRERRKDPSVTLEMAVEMYLAEHEGEIGEFYLKRQISELRKRRKSDT